MAYIFTEKREEASRANLKKAWAKHCAGLVPPPPRPAHLKHAFFARDLRHSVILLGENIEEYDAHVNSILAAFGPCTEREARILKRVAEATWRLLRGYHARAYAHARKLRNLLDLAERLTLKESKALAFLMVEHFEDERYLVSRIRFWQMQLKWLFGRFFIERTGNDQGFRLESAAQSRRWDRWAEFYEQRRIQDPRLGAHH